MKLDPFTARIDQNCIDRFTRFFNATLEDIFRELLQNARRAGATRVDVSIRQVNKDCPADLVFSDNGSGITDPSVLLDYGVNGWDRDTVIREDAAGLGMLSLANRNPGIQSKTPDGAAFRLELDTDMFQGRKAVEPQPIPESCPIPHGTTVLFDLEPDELEIVKRHADKSPLPDDDSPPHWLTKLAQAALYCPIDVHAEGRKLPRKDFLVDADCFHIEHWRGLRLGVTRTYGLHSRSRLNYFGNTVDLTIDPLSPVRESTRHVMVDVENCPELKMVLPARKEIHRTPFLDELRQEAEKTLFRSALTQPVRSLSFKDFQRARELGISLPEASPELKRWLPRTGDLDVHDAIHRRTGEPKKDYVSVDAKSSFVVLLDDAPLEQTIARALFGAGDYADYDYLDAVEPCLPYTGYDWYDALPVMDSVDIQVCCPPTTFVCKTPAPGEEQSGAYTKPPQLPDSAKVADSIRFVPRSSTNPDLDFPPIEADLCFFNHTPAEEWESFDYTTHCNPVFTKDHNVDVNDLSWLLFNCFFSPGTEWDSDSYETQERNFLLDADEFATKLIRTPEDALKGRIRSIVEREILWTMPTGKETIIVTIRGRNVDVAIGDPVNEAA